MGGCQNYGPLFGILYNKSPTILGSILGPPIVGNCHMGGCQNYGPLLGPLNTRCRIMLRTQKGP